MVVEVMSLTLIVTVMTCVLGDYCEEETNECTPWPCVNDGACTDGFNDYTCHCLPGFTGKRCETDIGVYNLVVYVQLTVYVF